MNNNIYIYIYIYVYFPALLPNPMPPPSPADGPSTRSSRDGPLRFGHPPTPGPVDGLAPPSHVWQRRLPSISTHHRVLTNRYLLLPIRFHMEGWNETLQPRRIRRQNMYIQV